MMISTEAGRGLAERPNGRCSLAHSRFVRLLVRSLVRSFVRSTGMPPIAASPGRSERAFRSGNERLYEAYNDLHALAQDFEKPFDAPAILVVGHQTDGKSGTSLSSLSSLMSLCPILSDPHPILPPSPSRSHPLPRPSSA